MSSFSQVVLPLILSFSVLFAGLFGFNPSQTEHVETSYSVEVNGKGFAGTGSRTLDGLRLDMGDINSDEKIGLLVDYATGITTTVDGETQTFSFADAAQELQQALADSFTEATGLNDVQLAYLFGGDMEKDWAAVQPMALEVLESLPEQTQNGEWSTATFSGAKLPRKLAVAMAKLLTDETRLDTLATLKAWDAFAPEVTDRKAAVKQALSDGGQALVGVKWPFTLTISGDRELNNGQLVLDWTEQSGVWHATLDFATQSGSRTMAARVEYTPSDAAAIRDVLEYQAFVNEDLGSVRQTLVATSGETEILNAELTGEQRDELFFLSLVADMCDIATGLPTGSVLGNLTVDTDRPGFFSGTAWYKTGAYDEAAGRFATEGIVELECDEGVVLRVTENGESKLAVVGETLENGDITLSCTQGDANSQWTLKTQASGARTIEGSVTRAGVETLRALATITNTGDGASCKTIITVEASGSDLEEPISAKAEVTCSLVEDGGAQPTAAPVEPGESPSLGQILAGVGPQATPAPSAGLKPGTYTGTADGFMGTVTATVTVDESGKVSAVAFTTANEDKEHGDIVPNDAAFAQQFIGLTGPADVRDVDAVSGATWTSMGAVDAVNAALEQAK